jgi:hypothetical protein
MAATSLQPNDTGRSATMSTRRQTCLQLGTLLGLSGLSTLTGCGPSMSAQRRAPVDLLAYSTEDQALIHKFRGIRGFELYMSGFGTKEDYIHAIGVDDKGGGVVEMAFAKGGDSKQGGFWRPTGPYKYVDFKLYKGNTVKYHWDNNGNKTGMSGHLYGQWRVPVAERIPDDLLDDLRANPKGGMRIKFRFHPDGVLLGWDIQRRPGFDPNKRDEFGNQLFVRAVHSFAGGDFREAQIINGQVVRKGWYIHPKTGERIETDF